MRWYKVSGHIYHITDCFLPCNVEALNEDKIYPIKTI